MNVLYRFSVKIHFNAFCVGHDICIPDTCEKHCVSVVIAKPDARAEAKRTEETLAPTPAPAAAPHTINTYRNEARHSAEMELQGETLYIFIV